MRLAVSERGYSSAVESLVSGNELAAQTATRLAGRLHGYAGMAGDDSTATDFAASYDEGATASMEALESLVGAFGALGKLVEASLTNHANADARSTLPGWARSVTGPPTIADRAVGVRVAAPPSSLGADDGPSGPAGLVLDLLQDVFWPNADTDRVRAAGGTWTTAAEAVGLLSAHCDSACAALHGERSPEIPIAGSVIRDVQAQVEELAAQFDALGAACTDYAEHVDTKRSELRSLLEDLAVEIGVTAVLGGLGTLLTGGAAAGVAGGAGAARLAAAGSKARGILASLRVLTGGTALGVRPVAVTAGEASRTFGRISRARVMLMEASGQGFAPGSGGPVSRLAASEGRERGHTLERHVGKSLAFLRERAARHPTAMHASSFSDNGQADHVVRKVLGRKAGEIDNWLREGSSQLRLDDVLDELTGTSVSRAGEVAKVRGVRVVLVRDASMPDGYWIKTAFPQP